MLSYIFRRLLLIVPTLFIILLINFVIIQFAPGGPVEQAVYALEQAQTSGEGLNKSQTYRAAQGIAPEYVEMIKAQYGFDKPAYERFWLMLKGYAQLDFGTSLFKDKSVISLLIEKLPVTISMGLWTVLLVYLIAIPLGIAKAVRNGSFFDRSTSFFIAVGYAVPSFVIAILLLMLFAGGNFWQWFPLQGLVSDDFSELSLLAKIKDYFWHLALPILAMVIGGFASLTYLTKFSFMEEITKQYTLTARAKGLSENRVLYKHIFRNAMLIVIASLPEVLVGIFFFGNFFIEIIFNLDGIGLLGFEAIVERDYPVIFGTLFIFTLIGLLLKLLSDILYLVIDPRINFDRTGAQ